MEFSIYYVHIPIKQREYCCYCYCCCCSEVAKCRTDWWDFFNLSCRKHQERPWIGNLVNFNHFLEEVENGLVHYVGDKNDLLLTLRSVLSFITGATNIPAVGFSTAFKIVFDHEAPVGRKMTANTCANVLTFPVNNIYMEYDLFKNEMITCIQDCQGFGMV